MSTTVVKQKYRSFQDRLTGIKYEVQGEKEDRRTLCRECQHIPFNDFLPNSTSTTSSRDDRSNDKPSVFCFKLEHIVSNRKWCKFCGLLFKSICRPEYDLLKAEHISKHLHTSEKLKDIKTFTEWVDRFSFWQKSFEGEDIWPFGYTRDQKEAAKETEAAAMDLFKLAEDKDLNAGVVDGMYNTEDDLSKVLQVTAFGAGVAGLVDNRKALAGAQLVTSQMAMFGIGKANALPCLFIVRAYPLDDAKAGVLSVRAFAHGRAPRAPLKEMCHFSLRLEQDEPRPQKEQLWYGRKLNPRIDIPFFEKCLVACQLLHGDACNKFSWPSQSDFHGANENFTFRLIDVRRMQIVVKDFEQIIKPKPHSSHQSYVVLSYTWGSSEWTELWDNQSQRPYYYNTITKKSTYDHPGHTQLTDENKNALLQPGSLKKSNVHLPKTIQDAIKVCRGMGEDFIWVDSLCIIQDEGHPDKIANITRMGRIYGEAVLTIVAGDAPSADAGMKGISSDRVLPDQIMDKVLGEIQLFLPIGIQQSFFPWESRAWTFQEKLLSRRMLLIASGSAVWRCRGGIWREDVNALDGNSESAWFPWPQLKSVPKFEDNLGKAGLQQMESDESVRLFRTPAFYQYVKMVEDFSGRAIGNSWQILDAFAGLQKVLESSEILDSPFRYGLPTRFLDVALTWQPRGIIRRRRNEEDRTGKVLNSSPPSWSWAGWESVGSGSKGANISYDTPFNVHADEEGLLMNPDPLGEERLRPLHQSLFGVIEFNLSKGTPSHKLTDLGLLNQRRVANQISRDWESFQLTRDRPLSFQDLGLKGLNDRHLVIHTEVASLWLGNECFRVRKSIKIGDKESFRETLQGWDPSEEGENHSWSYGRVPEPQQDMTVSRERWIIDGTLLKPVGTVKLHSGAKLTKNGTCDAITAIVLSEAQYLGNEKRVDVLGYPAYNIMAIERRGTGFAERVGLGKIYKSAWKRAGSKKEKIILE